MVLFLSMTLFPLLMIIAGAGDALSFRIPNWLTILITVAFFPMALATAMPLAALGLHVATGLGLFAVGFALFSFGLFGGGDAKLLAATGLWLGWPDCVTFLVLTAFAGGVLAVVVWVWSLINLDWSFKERRWFERFAAIKPNVPYGYAFAVGAILAFPQSWWISGAGPGGS